MKNKAPVSPHITKTRERVERIVTGKLCLELTDRQREMLADEIMHVCMLSTFDAMEEITKYIANQKK